MSIIKTLINKQLNESIVPSFSNLPKDQMVGYLVKRSFAFSTQIHVFHLLTKNAQEHQLLGDLYSNINDTIDGIAEEYLAMGGECSGMHQTTIYYTYSRDILNEYINDYYRLVNEVIGYLNSPSTESIKLKVIKLQDAIHKAEYQLTLM